MSSVCARTSACDTKAPPVPDRRYATNATTADARHTTMTVTPSATCSETTRGPYRDVLSPSRRSTGLEVTGEPRSTTSILPDAHGGTAGTHVHASGRFWRGRLARV